MYLGEQLATLSERRLALSAQLGVEHIALHTTGRSESELALRGQDGTWTVAGIREAQRRLAGHGMTLDVLALDVEQLWWSLLCDAPDRRARLDAVTRDIRVAAEAGVPCLKYRIQPIGVLRTGRLPGRGGARYAAFDVERWTDHSLTPAGRVAPERMWELIATFLEAIVPVAEASGVRLACHPQDPALPPAGLRGIPHVLGTVEAMQHFLDLTPSPVHGLNFCQGTVAEMCLEPRTEVLEAIRTFGRQGKIFMVHFRNITGGRLRFAEVYPDNGDVDMLQAMRAYKEAGYRGMFCPDHVPQSDADQGNERQFAFCLGYTRALLQAVGA
ncbi:MAG TPA: mannonate dehydratase [Chloroflexota bacterium]|nr:mannonate dehydratase [Chloroflexota bacterium]